MSVHQILLLLAGGCLLALAYHLYQYINTDAHEEFPGNFGAHARLYFMLSGVVLCSLITFYYAIP